jgi:hypothetical protein
MSQSVVLIFPTTITLESICQMLREQWDQNLFVHLGRCNIEVQEPGNGIKYVSIGELVPADEVHDDYLSNEDIPVEIQEKLRDTVFFHVAYNDYIFCSTVIQYLFSKLTHVQDRVWLDNDYGTLIPAETVLREFGINPLWDWRQSA